MQIINLHTGISQKIPHHMIKKETDKEISVYAFNSDNSVRLYTFNKETDHEVFHKHLILVPDNTY